METMRQAFKTIMADKRERKEFIGSFVSFIVIMTVLYMMLWIFG